MRLVLQLLGAAALLISAPLTPQAATTAPSAIIRGQVLNTGSPLEGVFVTARNTASQIATTVYTAHDGRFVLPALPLAHYDLRAHYPGFESTARAVDLTAATAEVELKLSPATERMHTASSAAWLAALPDGDMKREFIVNCATCHEIAAGRILKDGKARDAQRWRDAITQMKALDVYAVIPPDFNTEKYATWLAANLSPPRIAKLVPPPLARVQNAVITEYPVPKSNELPHDLVVGPDHRIWITAFWNSQIWALDPATGAVENYAVNNAPKTIAQVRALEFDRHGALWMVNGGTSSVVRLDPQTRKFDTYPLPMYPHDLVIDSSGDIWVNDYFANKERIARVAAKTGKVTVFPLPSANLPASAGVPLPYGLQVDAADRLWSTQLAANTLARFDIKTGHSKLYSMPDSNVGPRRTAIGLDGRVWIPEFNTGRLTSFDPKTETFATFDTGIGAAGIYDVVVDPRTGDVWLGAALASELIHFDRKTHQFTHYPLPTEPAFMRHLAIDPATGDVWSAYSSLPTAVPKVVRLHIGENAGE